MADISSFALQYNDVNFAQIYNSPYDLIITEGEPLAPSGTKPAISNVHVQELQAQGRTVIGYVDTSVTDPGRYYWQSSWVDTNDNPTANAPSWMQGQPHTGDAYMVKFWDPQWQKYVVDQAVDLVKHGYDGVFLDDIESFYTLSMVSGQPDVTTLARDMIDLVADVSAAVRAVNPNAYVVVNDDPYIGGYAQSDSETAKFLSAINAMLLENQPSNVIADAMTNIGGSAKILALFSRDSAAEKQAEAMDAWSQGAAAYVSPDTNYNKYGAFVNPGTNGPDTLTGGDGPNMLSGRGGDDIIAGHGGDDKLSGSIGSDTLSGDAGDDVLRGGRNADTLTGGDGADRFVYGAVNESSGSQFDTITDFDADADRLDIWTGVTGVDAAVTHGNLSTSTFAHDMRVAIGAGALAAHHAVLFTPSGGDYAGQLFLVVDTNGSAGFQPSQDIIIRLTGAAHMADFGPSDFS